MNLEGDTSQRLDFRTCTAQAKALFDAVEFEQYVHARGFQHAK
ncbi:hypothetical protein GALL_453760 [mine drainage metagenome]|uniref:Uncharacterized protein n=1 Tax=mine drainage metagenome TaxID=410659 RepID=A0A1J5PPB4_9ZZZZ